MRLLDEGDGSIFVIKYNIFFESGKRKVSNIFTSGMFLQHSLLESQKQNPAKQTIL